MMLTGEGICKGGGQFGGIAPLTSLVWGKGPNSKSTGATSPAETAGDVARARHLTGVVASRVRCTGVGLMRGPPPPARCWRRPVLLLRPRTWRRMSTATTTMATTMRTAKKIRLHGDAGEVRSGWYTSNVRIDQCASVNGCVATRSSHVILVASAGQSCAYVALPKSPQNVRSKTRRMFWKWSAGQKAAASVKRENGAAQESGVGVFASKSAGSVPAGKNHVRIRWPMGSHSAAYVPPPWPLKPGPMESAGPLWEQP
mmetsp:Transcript_86726/g.240554  ORF Transcript_86726/g.240554 Transcript_86726/m.240554 type:complete len:257 (-) Transcript_86726:771-1541(-)